MLWSVEDLCFVFLGIECEDSSAPPSSWRAPLNFDSQKHKKLIKKQRNTQNIQNTDGQHPEQTNAHMQMGILVLSVGNN